MFRTTYHRESERKRVASGTMMVPSDVAKSNSRLRRERLFSSARAMSRLRVPAVPIASISF